MKNKFWFVWRVDGHVPNHKHSSLGLAKQEAERIARVNPGAVLIVLESVCEVTKNDTIWTDHEEMQIPF